MQALLRALVPAATVVIMIVAANGILPWLGAPVPMAAAQPSGCGGFGQFGSNFGGLQFGQLGGGQLGQLGQLGQFGSSCTFGGAVGGVQIGQFGGFQLGGFQFGGGQFNFGQLGGGQFNTGGFGQLGGGGGFGGLPAADFVLAVPSPTVEPEEQFPLLFAWDVPSSRTWHDLTSLEVRFADSSGIAIWIRWNEATNTFDLIDPATQTVRASARAGSSTRLETDLVIFDVKDSIVENSGDTGLSVVLLERFRFKQAADDRTFLVENRGTTDDGIVEGAAVGIIRVGSNRTRRDNDDDKERRLTEEQRQQRERTNRSGKSDVHTEGNVIAVEKAADGKSLLATIAMTRGETLVVQVPCSGDGANVTCPDIQAGDYLEADGYQNGVGDPNSYFVASDSYEVLRNGKKVK